MDDLEAKFPFREALVAAFIVETEITGVDHRVSLHIGHKSVDDSELAVGVADQQESHELTSNTQRILHSIYTIRNSHQGIFSSPVFHRKIIWPDTRMMPSWSSAIPGVGGASRFLHGRLGRVFLFVMFTFFQFIDTLSRRVDGNEKFRPQSPFPTSPTP